MRKTVLFIHTAFIYEILATDIFITIQHSLKSSVQLSNSYSPSLYFIVFPQEHQ